MGYIKKDKKQPELFEYSEGKEKEVYYRIEGFCAYQERCEKDVVLRLKEWKVPSEMFEEILHSLNENNFLNQQRFGEAFAGGKFRLKKWGKQKIAMHLYAKNFNQEDVNEAIEQIPDSDYRNALELVLERKSRQLKEPDKMLRKKKLLDHARSKGYELNLIFEILEARKDLLEV